MTIVVKYAITIFQANLSGLKLNVTHRPFFTLIMLIHWGGGRTYYNVKHSFY
jgi:hypothetical protein